MPQPHTKPATLPFQAGLRKITQPWVLVAAIISLSALALGIYLLFSPAVARLDEKEAALRQVVSLGKNQITSVLDTYAREDISVSPEVIYPIASRLIFQDGDTVNQVIIFNRNGMIISMPLAPHLEGANIFRLHDRNEVALYQALALAAISNKEGDLRSITLNSPSGEVDEQLVGFAVRIPELNAFMATVSHTSALSGLERNAAPVLLVLIIVLGSVLAIRLFVGKTGKGGMNLEMPPATETVLLENMIEYNNDAVVVLQNGLVTALNVHFAHLLGRHRQDLLGTPLLDHIRQDDSPQLDALAVNMKNRVAHHVLLHFLTTTQDYLQINCLATPVLWKGNAACLLCLELTTSKTRQPEAPSCQTPIQHFLNHLPIGVAIFDTSGQLQLGNHEWMSQWSGSIPGEKPFNIYDSPLATSISLTRALSQAFSGRDGTVHAYEYRTPQDECRWLQIVFRPMFTEGEITAVCMLQTDITVQMRSHRREQELAQQLAENKVELTQALEHFQNLVDANPATIIGVDKNGIIRTWNTGAEKRFDLLRNWAVGQQLTEAAESLARHKELVSKAIKEKVVLRAGKVPSVKEGLSRYEDIIIYPFSSNENEGAFVSIDDVTTRIRMEEQHLQKEKLSSISVFAAGLAHEMNNPLGVILHGAQNLRRRLTDTLPANEKAARETGISLPSLAQYMQARNIPVILEQMEEAGMRSAGIVSSLVRFSMGTNSPLVAMDITPLLDRCVRMSFSDAKINLEAHTGHIKVEYLLQEKLPEALCAPEELEQALVQILSNAVKSLLATPPSHSTPAITISTATVDDYIQITIRDNGGGMSEEVKTHLFDPFFTTATQVGEGVGLGLSLAYFIITTIHQGSLMCESTLGAGAAFILRLRRASAHQAGLESKDDLPSITGFSASPSPLVGR